MRRARRVACVLLPAMLALAAALGSIPATARHHSHEHAGGESAPGEFDYYLLSLSWSPSFCAERSDSGECNGPRAFGFIVHGLWPQNERGWPEHCGEGDLTEDVVASMADLMPAPALIRHEWSTHGTCSGLPAADYFALVRRARGSIRVPDVLRAPREAVEESPAALVDAFVRANPGLAGGSLVATCSRQGVPRLREVHVCFDRNLVSRACSSDALREACRAPSLLIPPVR